MPRLHEQEGLRITRVNQSKFPSPGATGACLLKPACYPQHSSGMHTSVAQHSAQNQSSSLQGQTWPSGCALDLQQLAKDLHRYKTVVATQPRPIPIHHAQDAASLPKDFPFLGKSQQMLQPLHVVHNSSLLLPRVLTAPQSPWLGSSAPKSSTPQELLPCVCYRTAIPRQHLYLAGGATDNEYSMIKNSITQSASYKSCLSRKRNQPNPYIKSQHSHCLFHASIQAPASQTPSMTLLVPGELDDRELQQLTVVG